MKRIKRILTLLLALATALSLAACGTQKDEPAAGDDGAAARTTRVFWRSTFPRIRAARRRSERSKNFRSSRIAPAAAGILEAECFSIGRCCFQYGQGNIAESDRGRLAGYGAF